MRFYWELRFRPFLVYLYMGPSIVKNASLNMSSFENCICAVTMGADFKILTKADFLGSFILFWC